MKKTLKFLLSLTAFAMVAGSGLCINFINNKNSESQALESRRFYVKIESTTWIDAGVDRYCLNMWDNPGGTASYNDLTPFVGGSFKASDHVFYIDISLASTNAYVQAARGNKNEHWNHSGSATIGSNNFMVVNNYNGWSPSITLSYRDPTITDGWYLTGSNPDFVPMSNSGNEYSCTFSTTAEWSGLKVISYYQGTAYDHSPNDVNDDTGGKVSGTEFNKGGDGKAYVKKPYTYVLKAYTIDGTSNLSYRFSIKTYSITYDKGATGKGDNQTDIKYFGIDITLKGEIFTRGGFSQKGWSTIDGGSKEYDLGDTFSSNTSLTLYPFWEQILADVTMTFNTNGGSTVSSITGKPGASYIKPANPTKLNNTFDGWDPTLPDVIPNVNTTYTAKWKLDAGTYLAIQENGTQKMTRDGSHKFDVHQGYQLVVKNLILNAGDEVRPYFGYGDNDWNNIDFSRLTVSHPDYRGEQSNYNVKIKKLEHMIFILHMVATLLVPFTFLFQQCQKIVADLQ